VSGRLVVVTGGGGGIGRAVVSRFAAAGERVVAVGRDESALAGSVDAAGASATAERCDVTDEAAVGGLFERLGPVDVLVNNAGIAESAPLHRTTLASWRAHLDVHATGAFLCTRAVVAGLRERGSGTVVTVASVAGRAGSPYTAAYTAAKHAAVGLMRATAAELAGSGATANAVCPTYVDTPMTDRTVANITERTGRGEAAARGALGAGTPLGRLLEADEVAAAVAWLASPEAGAINGQAVVIDGGGIQA
jgi:NAD(P)-dependent dehydrogenase (short-subunit alcohol dehydrogenase family)